MTGTYSEQWGRLQKQLSNYGYLAHEDVVEVASDNDINSELIAAITAAQKDVVGDISGLTAVPMLEPLRLDHIDLIVGIGETLQGRFCGVPDRGGGTIGPLTFGSPVGRWPRGALTVSINTTGCNFVNLPSPSFPGTPVAAIMGAFANWQAASSFFTFTQVPPGSGEDIRVVFARTADDPKFGTSGGVLADAGYPGTPDQGNLRFDSAETWTLGTDPANIKVDLLAVALHEIGHILGLSHSNAPGGTMYPFAVPSTTIDAESRDAINLVYGWRPQEFLGDRGTSDRASLGTISTASFTSFSETPQMVWKGVDDDSGIYFSEFGGGWTPQQQVGGVGCSYSPSLAHIGIPGGPLRMGLFMAWKGVGDDSGIYWTRNMGAGWESQRNVADVGCSAAPALSNANTGQIYMAWKGVEDDTGIYWSTYDGAEGWSPQANIRGVGTSNSPALVGFNSMLYMFWKGIPGDSNVYYSFFDFVNDPIWKPQQRVVYYDYEVGGGIPLAIGTSGAMSAARRGDSILLAWKGIEGDSAIWFSLFRNGEFSGQSPVPNVGTSVGPSVVQAHGGTYMAWKGIDGDSGIYWSRL